MKYPSSVITTKKFQNFYTPIQTSNYEILSFSCFSRGKSELPFLNEKVKVVKICVKKWIKKMWIKSSCTSVLFPLQVSL